jgi:hypothetical protein
MITSSVCGLWPVFHTALYMCNVQYPAPMLNTPLLPPSASWETLPCRHYCCWRLLLSVRGALCSLRLHNDRAAGKGRLLMVSVRACRWTQPTQRMTRDASRSRQALCKQRLDCSRTPTVNPGWPSMLQCSLRGSSSTARSSTSPCGTKLPADEADFQI